MLESLFNNIAGLQLCNFILKSLQRTCFPVNTAKFLRTASFIEHLRWLLLYFRQLKYQIMTALWRICVLWTISILLTFYSDRVMGCSTKGASYDCFRKAVPNNFFQKVLLMNFISVSISIFLALSWKKTMEIVL